MPNSNKYIIQIGRFEFDPHTGLPEGIEGLQLDQVDDDYIIIQFKHSLNLREQSRLKSLYNLKLNMYIPNFSYLEYLNRHVLKELYSDTLFRTAVLYQPSFKFDHGLLETGMNETESNNKVVNIIVFESSDVKSILRKLKNLGIKDIRVFDDNPYGGRLRMQFRIINKNLLKDISLIKDIFFIFGPYESYFHKLMNNASFTSRIPTQISIWNEGIHGENQIIGVIDEGTVDINHCFFRDNVDNTVRPLHRKVVGLRNITITDVQQEHATFVSGIVIGDDVNNTGNHANRGVAWASKITYSNQHDLTSVSLLSYLVAANSDGAFIHTNSWYMYNYFNPINQYGPLAREVDKFMWDNEDNLVIAASGLPNNVPHDYTNTGPPGTCKNSLSVSASKREPDQMNFGDGSTGPTPDGRRKPDVMVPGCSVISAKAGTICDVLLDSVIWPSPTPICASSWATPFLAGCAALVRQYYIEGYYPTGSRCPANTITPTAALIKATILNGTIDMTGSGLEGYPNDTEGWGLVRLENVLHFTSSDRKLRVWDIRNRNGISTGQINTYQINIHSRHHSLKVTLVWTEAPGIELAVNPVVNNLDLKVISPDPTEVYYGNVFSGGASIPAGFPDTQNNVEMVYIKRPSLGIWTIQVIGSAVNVGNPGQGYALVVTGGFD